MTTIPQPMPRAATLGWRVLGLLRDYSELVKARVTSLVMMSAACGFYLASVKSDVSSLSWGLFHAVLGVGMVAGGTAAINQVMERDLDALMLRTLRRPLPAARMSAGHALAFGLLFSIGGIAYLALAANWLTALLAAATSAAYLFGYTPLKRRSPICTFVGAFPGAMPAVLGWVAATGSLGWEPLALFGIVWFWQFPHFHSIACLYREDYERARIRMLAVADQRATANEIIAYSLLLIPISLAPVLLHMSGLIYATGAVVLGAAFFWTGLRLARRGPECAPAVSRTRARNVLQASVFYLPLLFVLLMLNAK